jgi:pimeloyl-ACP methyl ester carboxylesterase
MARVFISYSHDNQEHLDRVLALSDRLRQEGVDCRIDQYVESPPEGWPIWCTNQVEDADFVLVVCTATYELRFQGREQPGRGLGAAWEGFVITQELYEAQGKNSKFIPAALAPDDSQHTPIILRGATRYDLSNEVDYEKLYRRLTGQPAIVMPKLGKIQAKPPRVVNYTLPELPRKQEFTSVPKVSTAAKDRKLTFLLGGMRSPRLLIKIVILIGLTGFGILIVQGVRTLTVNRLSPVIVPTSHFVGEHGKNKKLIVFVHGVMGDMDNSWTNTESNTSWPVLIRDDPSFSEFDVFVYGYGSPTLGNASTIEQISVRFLQQLKDFGFFTNYEDVDFIAHSMGGIVTKRMVEMLNTPAENAILQRIRTVILLSVPSNGATLAAVASWLSQNPQFKGMSPTSAADFLQAVEGDWATLLRARNISAPYPRTYSAYETVPTGPTPVVPQLYTSELSDSPVVAFDYNHMEIVKPKDRNADVYVWAKSRLLEEPKPRHLSPSKEQGCVQTDTMDVEIHHGPSVMLDEYWGSEPNRLQLFMIRLEYPGKIVNATCTVTDSYYHILNNDDNQRVLWRDIHHMSKNPDWNGNVFQCLGMTNTSDTRKAHIVVEYQRPCADTN